MSEYTCINPETLKEFKKEMVHFSHVHLISEYIDENNRFIHLYTKVERKIKGIKSSYWVFYTLNNSVISMYNYPVCSMYQSIRENIHVYLSDYTSGMYQFKQLMRDYKEETDRINVEIYQKGYDNPSDLFINNRNIEMIFLKLHRNNHKSILDEYGDLYSHYGIEHLYSDNYTYSQIGKDSRAIKDLEFFKENKGKSIIYE
jgi:hypothetical protein